MLFNFPENITYFWLAVMVVMLVIEAAIPGLVSIWFAAGALIAMFAAALGASGWVQMVLFIVVSAACLLITRPLAKKYVNSRAMPTNADMIIGKECVVGEKIDNILGTGTVTAGGKIWTAVSYDDSVTIDAGERAVVERIEGVKAVVKPRGLS